MINNLLEKMITKLAVKWLTKQIKKDKALWYTYQSSIAMTIIDNVHRYFPLRTDDAPECRCEDKNTDYHLLKCSKNTDASPDPLNKDYKPTLHEFCNICANDFLKLLTKKER